MKKMAKWTFCGIAMVVGSATLPVCAADLELAVRGAPAAYTIVVPAAASPSQKYAAEELRDFTEKTTGVKLPIATDAAPLPAKAILLGETKYTSALAGRGKSAAAKKGAKVSRPELHRDDYELCWVLKGGLRFTLPNESYEVKQGMSIQFDALLEHTYEALEDSELIIVHLKKGKRF